ncbi:hypothetical protein WDW37_20760 [Bdellovibrionota bacterium FG-1]
MDFSNRTYHEVLRGARAGLPDGNCKQYMAGYALRFEGVGYYVLKLWFQQERSYFIQKNQEDDDTYCVYSRKVLEGDGQVRFLNPVGYAKMTQNQESLEIVLPDLPRRYYMSLFAKP